MAKGPVAAVIKGVAADAGTAATNIAKAVAKVTTEAAEREEANLGRVLETEEQTASSFKNIEETPSTPPKAPKKTKTRATGTPGQWKDGLTDTQKARYDRIQDEANKAAARTDDEIRARLSPEQIAAGQANPYLRSMFVGSDIEKTVARNVADDPGITHMGTSQPGQEVADFGLGDGKVVDVTGGSQSSMDIHLDRDYINHPDQVITYPSLSDERLNNIFRTND